MRVNIKPISVLILAVFLLAISSGLQAKPKKKGWLGVGIEETTPSLRAEYDLGKQDGLIITSVRDNSPASKAGLQEDDVIIKFDGKSVTTIDEFVEMVQNKTPKSTVKLAYIRDGKERSTDVMIGKKRSLRHNMSWMAPGGSGRFMFFGDRPTLGIQLHALDENMASYFSGANTGAALVIKVVDESAAAKAGIKAGDVITALDGETIEEPDDLIVALEEYEEGDEVSIEYIRKGKKASAKATLESSESGFSGNIFNLDNEDGGLKMFFHGDDHKGDKDVEIILRDKIDDVKRKIVKKKSGDAII